MQKAFFEQGSEHVFLQTQGNLYNPERFVLELGDDKFALLNERGSMAVFPACSEHSLCPHVHT